MNFFRMNGRSDTVSLATRTLLAAGYVISGVHRQPSHIEFKCERTTRLGAVFQFLIAVTDNEEFQPNQILEIEHAAQNQGRAPVFVSSAGEDHQLNLAEFLDILGGAVPPWRVLTAEFAQQLVTASRNTVPGGLTGEAWFLSRNWLPTASNSAGAVRLTAWEDAGGAKESAI